MKRTYILQFVFLLALSGCLDPTMPKSKEANLTSIKVVYLGKAYSGTINGTNITFNLKIPYPTTSPLNVKVSIAEIEVSINARVDKKFGDELTYPTTSIVVTAEDGITTQKYTASYTIPNGGGNPDVLTYSGGYYLGQAIKDDILADKDTIITVSNVVNAKDYSWGFGSASGTKQSIDGRFAITKADIKNANAIDGNIISINVVGTTTPTIFTRNIATYKPLEIRSWQDLQAMRQNITGDYALMSDITFPAKGERGFPKEGFEPIALYTGTPNPYFHRGVRFKGSFDGGNFTIRNFSIKRPSLEFTGLFAAIELPAGKKIHRFILDHSGIEGYSNTAGIAGYMEAGIIENVAVVSLADSVYGYGNSAGGLVGERWRGDVTGYVASKVVGYRYVGGLVGKSWSEGTVAGYSTKLVDGFLVVGGLVGENGSDLVGFALGKVFGYEYVGGAVALSDNDKYSISNSYWDITSSKQNESHGSNDVGISNIANVKYNGLIYIDDKGTTNTTDDAEVFNRKEFTDVFELPKQSGKWPKLKNFSLPQPDLP